MTPGAFEFVYDLVELLNGLDWPGAVWLTTLTLCVAWMLVTILKRRGK